jgi:hypothetical protein
MIRAVAPEFLPPDPHADAPPAPQPAARAHFLPPNTPLPPVAGQRQNGRATAALALGAGGLGLLFFSAGMLFFLTIPASLAGWILGAQAKRRELGRDQANVAVVIGIVGVALGVIAAVVWIVLIASGQVSDSGQVHQPSDNGPHFDVIRLLGAPR